MNDIISNNAEYKLKFAFVYCDKSSTLIGSIAQLLITKNNKLKYSWSKQNDLI